MRNLMIAGCVAVAAAAALGCSTTNEAAKPAQAPPAKVVVVPGN